MLVPHPAEGASDIVSSGWSSRVHWPMRNNLCLGQRRNPVSDCAALAPRQGPATPRPSAMPPFATTGTLRHDDSLRRANMPPPPPLHLGFSGLLRIKATASPPASIPWATTTRLQRPPPHELRQTVEYLNQHSPFLQPGDECGEKTLTD